MFGMLALGVNARSLLVTEFKILAIKTCSIQFFTEKFLFPWLLPKSFNSFLNFSISWQT